MIKEDVRAIIFDFGGIFINLDYTATIESFKQLSNTYKDITLTLGYTASEYMDKLKKENEGVANINWKRDVTDLTSFFKDLDLFVFPTRYPAESLPNVAR